eukprot:1333897-Lingulodinium_polyedra.AAC.1
MARAGTLQGEGRSLLDEGLMQVIVTDVEGAGRRMTELNEAIQGLRSVIDRMDGTLQGLMSETRQMAGTIDMNDAE